MGVQQIPLPIQGCVNHLVEKQYYRLSATELPGNCLQVVFQDCTFGGVICVVIEFC